MEILIIIPARGGSKGIPRKNLRLLLGKPLLFFSINTALKSRYMPDVYVTSEDEEILSTAKKCGAATHVRDEKIADDKTTLDPVIFSCYEYVKRIKNKKYDLIVTMQPTSPLLTTESLDIAIERMIEVEDIDTIIAAKDSTHLSWSRKNNKFRPNYTKRVNRQFLTPSYTETGAFMITRNNVIAQNNRIGENVDLAILKNGEEIDIDTYEDWNLCEYYLRRKHILFVVTGNNTVGLGHVYNTLLIANDILNHKITFLVEKGSEMALSVIQAKNYPVFIQHSDDILEDIKKFNPDIVINDRLDTNKEYVQALNNEKYKVINFEDLGEGSNYADIVINAIYPEKEDLPSHYFGKDYFILRDEFILSEEKVVKKEIKNILVTFGGVDPNNYTRKVINNIYPYCLDNQINIIVVTGFGYDKFATIEEQKGIELKKNVSNISDYMLEADLIFTSAGRTVYEAASIGTPTIVMAQNEREMTHFFASSDYGFLNLGLGYELSDEVLIQEVKNLINSYETRKKMSNLMKQQDLKSGRKTVHQLIQDLIQD